jgi:hypothetical protein
VTRREPLAALALGLVTALGGAALAFWSGGYYPGTTGVTAVAALAVAAAWALAAPRPAAGLGRAGAATGVALALFAGWVLLSGTWSHSPARALTELDRALLYLVVFGVFACAGRSGLRARALVTLLALGAALVAVAGLAAWLAPHDLVISSTFERRRMSWPTGYWNTTGLMAGLGAVWCLHLASADREPLALRVAGAAAVVPLVAVIGYTASRGAIAATLAGALAYAAATRSRALVTGLLACGPAALAAALVVRGSPALATTELTPHVIDLGHRVAGELTAAAAAAAALRLALGLAEPRLATARLPRPGLGARVAALALVVCLAAAGAHHYRDRISSGYHEFFDASSSADSGFGRGSRLTSFSSDGRTTIWRIALDHGFSPAPLHGEGAGTFATLWTRHRTSVGDILDGQSLYVETLGELGLVGALLLLGALAAMALALIRRTRAPGAEGAAWAALAGGAATWLVFALVDWGWEMPACTLWLMAAGGLALSRPAAEAGPAEPRRPRAWLARAAVAGALLVVALVPYALARSTLRLDRAVAALQHEDCRRAVSEALRSRDAVDRRPEPFLVLAYCAARERRFAAAERSAAAAIHRDPADWEARYAQGLVRAAAGRDPRPALRAARRLNPRDRYVAEAIESLRSRRPAVLARRARALPLPLPLRSCGGPTRANRLAPCGNPRLPTLGGPVRPTNRP